MRRDEKGHGSAVTSDESVLRGPRRTIDGSGSQVAPRGFEEFYVDSWDWAVRVTSLITQSNDAGQEIAQDAFFELYRHWGDLEYPRAYLRTTIVNRCHNWQRRNRTRKDKLPLLVGSQAVEMEVAELADALAGLQFRQRAVLVLRYYCDFSEAEIAEALGCRPGTVKSLSSRALRRLRKEIPQ
ncbi:MAG: SigE family RNA polymerase sigma factor [Actinomycetota bacterium]